MKISGVVFRRDSCPCRVAGIFEFALRIVAGILDLEFDMSAVPSVSILAMADFFHLDWCCDEARGPVIYVYPCVGIGPVFNL